MTTDKTTQETIFFPFHTQAVRDLAWLIGSPSLMQLPGVISVDDAFCKKAYARFTELLHTLDKDPAPLLSFLQTSSHRRLGRYAESLLQFWLQHDSRNIVHAVNLAIQLGRRTIGEFDVLADIEGIDIGTLHVEMAVKFYLSSANNSAPETWIGPNGDDRLDRKLEKLTAHQLLLSDHPSSQEKLRQLYIDKVTPVLFTKGYFFYPYEDFVSHHYIMPLHANPLHAKGWWCPLNACKEPLASETHWTLISKTQWLSPAYIVSTTPPLTEKLLYDYIAEHFETHSYALLVAALEEHESGIWREKHRGFVVKDSWPANNF